MRKAATAPADSVDRRRARGMRSRTAVLERSLQLASREGLEGLTIGALAADLKVHKSSVFALFGSKLQLQLATLAVARAILIEQVVAPGLASDEGMPRLRAIGEAWCDYLGSDVFAGGCFLCAASTEMDGRPGEVRDGVAAVMREWIAVLKANVKAAIAAGDLRADVDAAAMAFASTPSAWPPTGSGSCSTIQAASSMRAAPGEPSSTRPPRRPRQAGDRRHSLVQHRHQAKRRRGRSARGLRFPSRHAGRRHQGRARNRQRAGGDRDDRDAG